MKKIVSVFFILVTTACNADNNCQSMSHNREQSFDNKELHHVSCYCNCSEYGIMDKRGTCIKCRHFRAVRPYVIVKNSEKKAVTHKAEFVHSREAANSVEFEADIISAVQVVCSAVKAQQWKKSHAAAKEALFKPLRLTTNKAD